MKPLDIIDIRVKLNAALVRRDIELARAYVELIRALEREEKLRRN